LKSREKSMFFMIMKSIFEEKSYTIMRDENIKETE